MKSKYQILKWDKAIGQDTVLRYLLHYNNNCYSMVLPRDFISNELIKKCGQFDMLGNIPVGWKDVDDDWYQVIQLF